MKFALFLGCNIPARVEQYDTASRAVLSELGVELVDYIDCRKTRAPVDKVIEGLEDEKQFVTIQVDFKPGGSQAQQHWVRAITSYEVDFLLMDPWLRGTNENVHLMTRYAVPTWEDPSRAIYRIATYRYDPSTAVFVDALDEKDMIVQDELFAYHP